VRNLIWCSDEWILIFLTVKDGLCLKVQMSPSSERIELIW
jgi:hypothetical protein